VCALTTGGHLLNGSSTARLRSGPGISHDRTRSAVCIGLKKKKRKDLAVLAKTPRLNRFFWLNVQAVALTRAPEN